MRGPNSASRLRGSVSPRRLPTLPPASASTFASASSSESPRSPRRRRKKKNPPPAPSSDPSAAFDEVDGAHPALDYGYSPSPSLRAVASPSEFPFPPPSSFLAPRSARQALDSDSPLFDKRKDPLLRHKASAQHRQVVQEVLHQQRIQRELEQERQLQMQTLNNCILEESEESDGFDIGPSFGAGQDVDERPTSKALDRWQLIRHKIEEVREERAASSSAKGWTMFVKHVKAVSDMEKARQDLYSRYGLQKRGGMSSPRGRGQERGSGTGREESPRIHSVNF